jgi:SAM-dependent methyltransferase
MPMMDENFWDERYRSADQVWSGQPNATLVTEAGDLAPGRALDIGAGEGADAIWLAERGWDVVAVDISSVALERCRLHAESVGVGDRITWVHTDVLNDALPQGPFDLVTSHYTHLASADRTALFSRCFDAVAPGGIVLIVAHHPSDLDTPIRRPPLPELFYTAEEIAEQVGEEFTVLVCDARPRVVDHHGESIQIRDTVFVAKRAVTPAG